MENVELIAALEKQAVLLIFAGATDGRPLLKDAGRLMQQAAAAIRAAEPKRKKKNEPAE